MKITRFLLIWCVCVAVILWSACAVEATETERRIVVFGDSLAAGYNLPAEESLSAQLEDVLHEAGHEVVVDNAGVSGDTTAGGRARLPGVIARKPDIVVIVLGGNDVLRGLLPKATREHMEAMGAMLDDADISFMIAGVKAPVNLGVMYASDFNPIFEEVAEKYDAGFYPFILDGVYNKPELLMDDGIHPNVDGVRIIAEGLGKALLGMLDR